MLAINNLVKGPFKVGGKGKGILKNNKAYMKKGCFAGPAISLPRRHGLYRKAFYRVKPNNYHDKGFDFIRALQYAFTVIRGQLGAELFAVL